MRMWMIKPAMLKDVKDINKLGIFIISTPAKTFLEVNEQIKIK